MDNKSPNSVIEGHNAHANFRRGLNDYHDGSSLNHNLGNDDYFGSNELEVEVSEIILGYEALGNNSMEEEELREFF